MNGTGRYRLINAKPSPFGRKVAIALHEKDIEHDVTYDVPWGPETCTPQFSPFQQLPILITPEGSYIYESGYILEWLEAHHPYPALISHDPTARLETRHRQMLGEKLMEFSQALVFEHHRPDPSQPWIDRQSRKIEGGLDALEAIYAQRSTTGDTVDLGDIAVATTLLVLDFVVPAGLSPDLPQLRWRQRAPRLAKAVDLLDRRPSFAATRPQMMDVDLQATVSG